VKGGLNCAPPPALEPIYGLQSFSSNLFDVNAHSLLSDVFGAEIRQRYTLNLSFLSGREAVVVVKKAMSFEDFLDFSLEAENDSSLRHNEEIAGEISDEDGEISDEGGSTSSSSSSSSGMYETTLLSSHDSGSVLSYNGGFSFDSDTLQDFGSIVSLPPGTLAGLILRHHGQDTESEDAEDRTMSTIVSSAPSGSYIPVPEASQDMWAVSPHPNFVPGSVNALSTVCTDTLSYQRLLDDAASASMEDDDAMSYSSEARDGTLTRTPAHERAAFEAIANQLLRDVPRNTTTGAWYSRFTEFDWDQLREIAKVVLATTGTGPPEKLLQLPPSPPVEAMNLDLVPKSGNYKAEELIPTNFVCPCCSDVLVGALALDCGCTVCAACWEADGFLPPEIAEQVGYVWVEERRCESCKRTVHSAIPCQALDVAVFQIVNKLDSCQKDGRTQSMKLAYYSRLEAWRHTVLARNESATQKQALQADEMLARLIQEEEDILWKKERTIDLVFSGSSRTLLIIGQAAIALLSSLALNAFVRRRRE
jgi:hypothetical protein